MHTRTHNTDFKSIRRGEPFPERPAELIIAPKQPLSRDALHALVIIMDKLESAFTSVNAAFKAFDKDRSGTISARELTYMCKQRFNLPISDAVLHEITKYLDSDNSGLVEFAELQQAFGEAILHSSKGTFLGRLGNNKPVVQSAAAPPTRNVDIVMRKVQT